MNSFIILAQAGSTELDFIRQIPAGAIMTLCVSSLALVGVLVYIVQARSKRSQRTAETTPRTRSERPVMLVEAARLTGDGDDNVGLDDLPDLDLLVDTPQQKPAPQMDSPSMPAQPPARSAAIGTYSVQVSDGETAQAVEVVTILRDVMDGGLIIQMGDKIYRNLGSDETFKERFLTIMRELSPMVSQASKSKPEQPTIAAPPKPAEPIDSPSAEPDTASLRDLVVDDEEPEPTVVVPPPPAVDGTMPGDLPRYSMDQEPQVVEKKGGLLGRTKKEFIPVPELDLAGAIEAYLQHKLKHLPDYNTRSIHVHPSPDGGVAIEVDGKFFDAVGDVDDVDVRTLLSQTIQEWQERNTNG